MCGIAGILRTGEMRGVGLPWVQSLSLQMAHRGPDDVGYLGWNDVNETSIVETPESILGCRLIMCHRRLSIIDTTKSGWQPMQTEDGRFIIIFNGEIYNYLEIRSDLEKAGHVFRSQSDTEVLLRGYAQWGIGVLPRLVGMFAFVMLDIQREVLFLARDYFGIKPLYYATNSLTFGFSSEPAMLLSFPGVRRRVNTERLCAYLRFGVTDYGEDTLWGDIRQVPAASYLEVNLSTCHVSEPTRYWRIPKYHPVDIGLNEAALRLRELFIDSVRLHLRSDVPVGTCLSGGIDSSSIVSVMRHILGESGEIHSFSYLATDQRINERKWMNFIELTQKTIPHYTCPTFMDLKAIVSDLIKIQGEPFGSTSIFAQYKVFELASEAGVKVMLDGQGADEMLGGYIPYLSARLASMLTQGSIADACRFYRKACSRLGSGPMHVLNMALGLLLPGFLQGLAAKGVGINLFPRWMNGSWFRKHDIKLLQPWQSDGPYHLRSQLEKSLQWLILPGLLRFEDRNSMRFSIESRVPFLTPGMVEFVYTLPESFLINDEGETKSVFRAAMRGLVPDAILDRRDKVGFATSETDWLRLLGPWVESRLTSEVAKSIPALNNTDVIDCWKSALGGQQVMGPHIWRWVNLIEWASIFNAEFSS